VPTHASIVRGIAGVGEFGEFNNLELPIAIQLRLSYGRVLIMGVGRPKQHTKFEVANFSRCRDNKGDQLFRSFPSSGCHAHFSLGGPWQTQTAHQISSR